MSRGAAWKFLPVCGPVCQYTKLSPQDRNGLATLGVDFLLARSAAGGDDELSEAWT